MNKCLSELQHWMQKVVQHPHTCGDEINTIIDEGIGIGAKQRLAIYQRNYHLRLLECMQTEYPLLIKAFSVEWFNEITHSYLSAHPPSSTNLHKLGENFPNFLQNSCPDRSDSHQEAVFDFIVSLAKLERFHTETSRGLGSENIINHQFDLMHTHDLETLKVTPVKNNRLLKSSFQLLESIEHLDKEVRPSLIYKEQFIAVCRKNYRTHYFKLTAWQFKLLSMLQNNSNLGEVLPHIHAEYPNEAVYGFAPVFIMLAESKGCVSVTSV